SGQGSVALVGAGPGPADLLTLRAARLIAEADAVFHDRLVDPSLLELARPDAWRVCVGKAPGAHHWPQDRIDALLVRAARDGLRVVRLKCGDPGVFGRAAEEMAALDAAGLPWRIVPGVTAASAAAAAAGSVLTERGETDALVLATAHAREGAAPPDLARRLVPGTTLALYMGVGRAPAVAKELLSAGQDPDLPVEVVFRAERPDQTVLRLTLGGLAQAMKGRAKDGPAIIFVRRPAAPVPEAPAAERAAEAASCV
ncbi:MAG: uroporphyrinogen-III C-methyltransferase, partial [Pseudomonadota bacterium]